MTILWSNNEALTFGVSGENVLNGSKMHLDFVRACLDVPVSFACHYLPGLHFRACSNRESSPSHPAGVASLSSRTHVNIVGILSVAGLAQG